MDVGISARSLALGMASGKVRHSLLLATKAAKRTESTVNRGNECRPLSPDPLGWAGIGVSAVAVGGSSALTTAGGQRGGGIRFRCRRSQGKKSRGRGLVKRADRSMMRGCALLSLQSLDLTLEYSSLFCDSLSASLTSSCAHLVSSLSHLASKRFAYLFFVIHSR
jgi:hypothetical protein